MRRTIGILSLICAVGCFLLWGRLVMTGNAFDGSRLGEGVPLLLVAFVISSLLTELCLMKDFAKFAERISGEGHYQKSDEIICFYCGEVIEENSKFCPCCGKEVKEIIVCK